ncbi:MAG: OmpH family outer membrane protein [Tannerella sp.]|jgi:outer membrane protein|nr:OmpH family outer membrane protein [Tannerella sp.]
MKKFIVFIMLLLPLGMVAQEVKIAVVKTNEIFNIMPEVADMESKMAAHKQQYQQTQKVMQDEYTRKYADLTAQGDTLNVNIRNMRLQEIQDIATRLENFVPMATEDLEKKQEELLAPIQEKVQKAINEVGEENGYTYIINPGVMLYMGPSAVDATEKVKAKLGLK